MATFSGMVMVMMVIILMTGMMMTMKEEEEGVDRWELSLAGAESQAPALALPLLCLPHHLCSTLAFAFLCSNLVLRLEQIYSNLTLDLSLPLFCSNL